MSRELKTTVREFANSISENDLMFVTTRLADRFSGDMAEGLNFLSKNRSIDGMLSSARSADDFYDLLDVVIETLRQECDKKNLFGNAA